MTNKTHLTTARLGAVAAFADKLREGFIGIGCYEQASKARDLFLIALDAQDAEKARVKAAGIKSQDRSKA